MVVLHATDLPTVHLSSWARSGATTDDVDRALHTDRSLVKQLAMRRTLFVAPRELMPALLGSASARVAEQQRGGLLRDLIRSGFTDDAEPWLTAATTAVVAHFETDPTPRSTRWLREQLPELAGRIDLTAVQNSAVAQSVAGRVMTLLEAEGHTVRGPNEAGWKISRPLHTSMEHWLGTAPAALPAGDGYRRLVELWLRTFGPGTVEDLRWWLGSTLGVVRATLADLEAVPVALEDGGTGWLLPDDLAVEGEVGDCALLLPMLDPTVMGWKGRDFYLGPHGGDLFDTNGNAGTTVWWQGRIVGCWAQGADARVRTLLLTDLPAAAHRAIDAESERLTAWLGGESVNGYWPSPALLRLRAELGSGPGAGRA